MRGESERGKTGLVCADPELLVELADQRRLGSLAFLHLAAWKLPCAREMLAGRPLGEQHPAIDIDQRHRGDKDDGFGGINHLASFEALLRKALQDEDGGKMALR